MIITSNKKSNRWLWLLLIATISITLWTAANKDSDDDNSIELAEPVAFKGTKNIQSQSGDDKLESNELLVSSTNFIPWDKLKRDNINASISKDIFSPHSWVIIPPAPKVKPTPPPPPVAPPSPFNYFGKMEDGPKGTLLFLIANNKVYSVKKGEKIDAFWSYDSDDANNVYMTYLPLNLPQVLSKNQKISAQVQANVPAEINY